MAVTESVKIVFEVDDKALVSTVAQLQAVGKVSQEDAAKFNALSAASKAAGASLDGASKGAKQFAEASKDAAKSTTEVANAASDLKDVGSSLSEAGKAASATSEGFIGLRQRLAEAKIEVQQLAEQFGATGPEFEAAVARAGELQDEFDTLNRQIRLSNPEGKIQAFQNLGQGIVGAFQTATGALQAFGVENEEVQEIAQRFQGALNIAQGIQSIVGLKEAYQDVKVILGVTTAAQNTLTVATNAGTAATGAASGALRGFAAALASTGVGALVVALGALVGAYITLTSSSEQYILTEQQVKDIKDKSKQASDELADAENQLALRRGQISQKDIELQKASKATLDKLAEARKREFDANKALADAQEVYNLRIEGAIAGNREEEVKYLNTKLNSAKATKALVTQEIADIKKQFNAKVQLIELEDKDRQNKEQDRKKQEDAQDREQRRQQAEQRANEIISKRLSIFAEEQKQRAFSIELNKQYGATEEEILRQKIFNNQADQEGLNAILAKAKGTSQFDQVQSQINDKVREEILLRKELEQALEIPLLPLKNQFEAQKNVNKELEKTGPIAVKVNSEWKGSAQELIDDQEKLAELQKQRADAAFEVANATAEIFIEANRRQYEEEIANLEEAREQGVITEEQYQLRLKKIKQKGAEDAKKTQIFQATMNAAQAILSALSDKYPDPASKVTAVALAATISAINLAKILATPIPKFKKGTLAVPGQDTGDDSVMAMLRPGEAVIPTEINREYANTIKAIYTRKVSSKELNEFVESRSRMTVVKDEPVFNFNPVTLDALFKRDIRVSQMSSSLQRSSGGIIPTINVKADVDTYALGKVITKNRGVELTNPEQVAKALAAELSKTNNLRRQ